PALPRASPRSSVAELALCGSQNAHYATVAGAPQQRGRVRTPAAAPGADPSSGAGRGPQQPGRVRTPAVEPGAGSRSGTRRGPWQRGRTRAAEIAGPRGGRARGGAGTREGRVVASSCAAVRPGP